MIEYVSLQLIKSLSLNKLDFWIKLHQSQRSNINNTSIKVTSSAAAFCFSALISQADKITPGQLSSL